MSPRLGLDRPTLLKQEECADLRAVPPARTAHQSRSGAQPPATPPRVGWSTSSTPLSPPCGYSPAQPGAAPPTADARSATPTTEPAPAATTSKKPPPSTAAGAYSRTHPSPHPSPACSHQ